MLLVDANVWIFINIHANLKDIFFCRGNIYIFVYRSIKKNRIHDSC